MATDDTNDGATDDANDDAIDDANDNVNINDNSNDNINGLTANQEELIALANQIMPFGKYQNRILLDLPEPYLVWFKGQGWPSGKLGERMAVMYEVKTNGLEKLLRPLVREGSE